MNKERHETKKGTSFNYNVNLLIISYKRKALKKVILLNTLNKNVTLIFYRESRNVLETFY